MLCSRKNIQKAMQWRKHILQCMILHKYLYIWMTNNRLLACSIGRRSFLSVSKPLGPPVFSHKILHDSQSQSQQRCWKSSTIKFAVFIMTIAVVVFSRPDFPFVSPECNAWVVPKCSLESSGEPAKRGHLKLSPSLKWHVMAKNIKYLS